MKRLWIDADLDGKLFFATKKQARERYPNAICCEVQTRFQKGWAAFKYGCTILLTPDGRELPRIVSGWCDNGHIMFMRGNRVWAGMEPYAQAIVNREVEMEMKREEQKADARARLARAGCHLA